MQATADNLPAQRSEEWRQQRLGRITASRFKDVLTQPRAKAAREAGELSETAWNYMCELVAEVVYGIPCDRWSNEAMRWGIEWEAEARQQATERCRREFQSELTETGFHAKPDDEWIGCSPDGLIGDDSIIEIKCPFNPARHMKTVMTDKVPPEYEPQIQGCLWILKRSYFVYASFDPRLEGKSQHALHMIYRDRDNAYIAEVLEPRVRHFRERYLAELEKHTKAPF